MKPILFNSEMVRAILDGRKTTTRRIIKGIPIDGRMTAAGFLKAIPKHMDWGGELVKLPYQIGDVLYVRETWQCFNPYSDKEYVYKATNDCSDVINMKWHPSIHMPKEAARIFLRVTNLGAERVQEITEEQALSEGLIPLKDQHGAIIVSAKGQFKAIWIELYGIDSWNANPFVWAYEFERCEKESET